MFGIGKLMSAIGTLAEALLGLAGTVNEANTALRHRLGLDEAPEVLEHEAATNGRRKVGVK